MNSGSSDWTYLEKILDELGMELDEFRQRYSNVNTDHCGNDGRVIIDRGEMEEGPL